MSEEKTTLGLVTEIGTFGDLNMQDPTVKNIQTLMEKTNDPYLKEYLAEQMNQKGGK